MSESRPAGSPDFQRYNRDPRDRSGDLEQRKHRHRARYLIDGARRINGLAGKALLDAGCGQGLLLSLIRDDADLFGFDANESLCSLNLVAGRADISVRDIYDTGYPAAAFDVIFCSQVIEHLDRPREALAELARVLRPGGLLAASVPYDEKIKMEICVHCGRATPRNGHLHSFNEENLPSFLPEDLLLIRTVRICSGPVYDRFHRLPVPVFRPMDRAAISMGLGLARWMVFFARKAAAPGTDLLTASKS